jgi:hypothetical protein
MFSKTSSGADRKEDPTHPIYSLNLLSPNTPTSNSKACLRTKIKKEVEILKPAHRHALIRMVANRKKARNLVLLLICTLLVLKILGRMVIKVRKNLVSIRTISL